MKKRLTLLAILLGFFILISFFLDLRIYRNYTLLVGDKLYYADPTFKAFGGGLFNSQPSNPTMDTDNNLFNYPFRDYARDSFAREEIPWWNPYVGMGVPFVALGSGVFDPVAAFAGFLAPGAMLNNMISVLALWIAAFGMFMFLGALGLSLPARIFGAVAFTFSGWTVVWLGRQNFMVEIWMPWIFWATERMIRKRNASRIGLLALCSGLICLPGHLQTSFHIFAALSLYVLVRIFQEKQTSRSRLGSVLSVGLAVALGIGIALVQVVPSADLVGQSDLPSAGRNIQRKPGNILTAVEYGIKGDPGIMRDMIPTNLTAVSPLFFGTPRHMSFWWPARYYPETTLYVGLLPLFFAFYGFSRIRQMRGLGVWFVLALLSIGVINSLPIFNFVNYLPFFDQINNGRLRLVYRFAVIVAAAIGFEYFTKRAGRHPSRSSLFLAAAYSTGALTIPLIVFWILPSTPIGKAAFTQIGAKNLWAHVVAAQVPILVLLTVSGAAITAWKLGLFGREFFRAAVIIITFADSFWFFHDFNPVIPSSFVFPETKVVEFLKKDPSLFRVSSTSFGDVMHPNLKQVYDIFDIDLFSVLAVDRYAAVQSLVNPPSSEIAQRIFRFSKPESYQGLINLMNVKYIVAPKWKDTLGRMWVPPFHRKEPYRLVYDQEVSIYRNMEVLPRAFLVGRSKILDTPQEVLASLARPDFDPLSTVLLEDSSGPELSGPVDKAPAGNAEIVSLKSNEVIVHANTETSAYLVLSEVNYPGWKVSVDGREQPIYTAYYLFRSVYLGPGTHEIVFTFMPESYALAWKISLACLVLTCVLLLTGFKKGRSS